MGLSPVPGCPVTTGQLPGNDPNSVLGSSMAPFSQTVEKTTVKFFRISFLLILTQTTEPSCENWSLHRSTLHSLLLKSTGTKFKPLQFLLIQSYSQAWNIPVDYKQKTKHWGKIKHLTFKLIYYHSIVLELVTLKATRTLWSMQAWKASQKQLALHSTCTSKCFYVGSHLYL